MMGTVFNRDVAEQLDAGTCHETAGSNSVLSIVILTKLGQKLRQCIDLAHLANRALARLVQARTSGHLLTTKRGVSLCMSKVATGGA
jgi:hypothetical protein